MAAKRIFSQPATHKKTRWDPEGQHNRASQQQRNQQRPEHLYAATPRASWTCCEEWMDVYSKIHPLLEKPEDKDLVLTTFCDQAINVMEHCWRGCWNDKNEAIEVTINVLRALQSFHKEDHTFAMCATMAIIRFVKVVSENLRDQRSQNRTRRTILSVCQDFGVPEWIVRIRHEASHNDMRDSQELSAAIFYTAKWLKRNVWDIERKRIGVPSYMTKAHNEDADAPEAEEIAEVARVELQRINNRMYCGQLAESASRILRDIDFDIMAYVEVFSGVLAYEFLAPNGVTLASISGPNEMQDVIRSTFPIVPKSLKDQWLPVVEYVMRHASGTNALLFNLARICGGRNSDRDHLACAWSKLILESIPRNKSSVRLWDTVDWSMIIGLLTEPPERPTKNVCAILPILSYWVSNKDEYEKLQKFIRLTKIIVGDAPSQMSSTGQSMESQGNTPPKTLADLRKEFHSTAFEKRSQNEVLEPRWNAASDFDWSRIPIGLTPSQANSKCDLYRLLLIPTSSDSKSPVLQPDSISE